MNDFNWLNLLSKKEVALVVQNAFMHNYKVFESSAVSKELVNNEGLFYYEYFDDEVRENEMIIRYANMLGVKANFVPCEITNYDIIDRINEQIHIEEKLRENGKSNNEHKNIEDVFDIYHSIINNQKNKTKKR